MGDASRSDAGSPVVQRRTPRADRPLIFGERHLRQVLAVWAAHSKFV
jgi:hypothetical protein